MKKITRTSNQPVTNSIVSISEEGGVEVNAPSDEFSIDLPAIVQLITIRNYIVNAIGASHISTKEVNALNKSLLVLDKKITNKLTDSNFETIINSL